MMSAASTARVSKRPAVSRRGGRRRPPPAGATRRASAPAKPRVPSVWLNRLLVLAGGAVVAAAAIQAILFLRSIPVQYISVIGELEHTRAQEVQDMVQPALAGGFLQADLAQIRAQLEALPWIYRATVRRRWPNALEIDVTEQLPIARWGTSGFLNHEGEVFQSQAADKGQSLPLLEGPEGSARALMASYLRMAQLLAPLDLAVNRLALDARGELEAELSGGMQLSLGDDQFPERMQRFVALYRGELASRAAQVQHVDLRYASGIAVQYNETSAVAGI